MKVNTNQGLLVLGFVGTCIYVYLVNKMGLYSMINKYNLKEFKHISSFS